MIPATPLHRPHWFLSMLFCSSLMASLAFAQDRPDVATLQAQLSALKEEVRAEEAGLQQARASADQQRAELQRRRATLSEQIVSLETERLRLDKERADLVVKLREAAFRHESLNESHRSLVQDAGLLAERLNIYLREVPAHDETRAALSDLLHVLSNPAAVDAATVDSAVTRMVLLADTVHAEASTVRTRPTRVWTSRGMRESVTLLTAGHIAFAYRADDGRVGLSLNSPKDATGFRWTEELTPTQVGSVASAIDVASEGDAALVPMDVSGQLRVETVTEGGVAAWFESGGPIMYALAGVAGLAMLLVLERMAVLYLLNGVSRGRVATVLRHARDQRFDEAERASRSGRGAVSRTLAACLQRRDRNIHAMEDSVQEQLLHETPRLERFLGGIAILAAVAPLLGLLGTVTGIIQTFSVIRAFGNANPGAMAGGISEALVTTAAGLVIAIPILLLHGVLRGRVDRIIAEAEKHAATLLNVVAHDAKATGSEGE